MGDFDKASCSAGLNNPRWLELEFQLGHPQLHDLELMV